MQVAGAHARSSIAFIDIFTPQDLADLDAAPAGGASTATWSPTTGGPSPLARNGRLGIVSGRASESAAANDAVRDCARAGGTECAVSALGPFLVAPK